MTGWWAIDVASYLLTQLDWLRGDRDPAHLDDAEVIAWIRERELDWAPGCVDLRAEVPWNLLRRCTSDAELVELVLRKAVEELDRPGADALSQFAAQRMIPRSTLEAYGYAPAVARLEPGIEYADGHVHQGAALPLDVMLHWTATRMSSKTGPPEGMSLPMKDTIWKKFNPTPLLLLLRALVDDREHVTPNSLDLVVRSAGGDTKAWDALNGVLDFEESTSDGGPDTTWIDRLKKRAGHSWDPERRVALLRTEAILHAAVTQRQAGLDVFVDLFEQCAALRRSRLMKERYYERSIDNHVARSQHRLRRLELRLGEPVARAEVDKRTLEHEYLDALKGYRAHIGTQDDPVRVTFPWGLVKSLPKSDLSSDHWRFNPRGIYRLTEALLELLADHRQLSHFIDGIDVCGFEESEPNWLFAPAFTRFATQTEELNPIPVCRFHAGEWQWTPLHGLRRIDEFLSFPLPVRTPRRIGHGLALRSNDWRRIGDQPVDELLDDLVWVRSRIGELEAPPNLVRTVDRLILDLQPIVYSDPGAASATPDALIDAYHARFDIASLERISFLDHSDGCLSFPDRPPSPRRDTRSQLLVSHLERRATRPPPVSQVLGPEGPLPATSIHALQMTLVDLYELLACEVVDDVRWTGTIVEACPTSNILTGGVRGHRHHPMRTLIDQGVLATVNTDDPSLFHSWMPEELAHAERHMNVPQRQVKRSSQLSLKVVAPGLHGADVVVQLDEAIHELETQRQEREPR